MDVRTLKRTIEKLPADTRVYITFPDDEVEPMCLTYDVANNIFRLCKDSQDVGPSERVLEDNSEANGQWHKQARLSEDRYARVVLETNWRPLVTAPKDGTKILLAKIVGHPSHDTALWWATRGSWSSKWENWNDGVEPCGLAGPTHWLPVNAYGIPLSSLSEETS